MAEFSGLLKTLREAAGLSQEELATRAGIHRVQVNRLEAGTSVPSWPTVQALARVLGVSCDTFQQAPADTPPTPRKKLWSEMSAEEREREKAKRVARAAGGPDAGASADDDTPKRGKPKKA